MDGKGVQAEAARLTGKIQNPSVREKARKGLEAILADIEGVKDKSKRFQGFVNNNSTRVVGPNGIVRPVIGKYDDGVRIVPPEVAKERYQAQKAEKRLEVIAQDENYDPNAPEELPVNQRGTYGYTPLHKAALAGDINLCKELLEQGADVTIKDNSGEMAWQKADRLEFTEIVDLLKPKEPKETK